MPMQQKDTGQIFVYQTNAALKNLRTVHFFILECYHPRKCKFRNNTAAKTVKVLYKSLLKIKAIYVNIYRRY